jgi:hypothetical protein
MKLDRLSNFPTTSVVLGPLYATAAEFTFEALSAWELSVAQPRRVVAMNISSTAISRYMVNVLLLSRWIAEVGWSYGSGFLFYAF